tara:strand:+ start:312 stop:494 length:183 start_codon:yes stop_codon:yes gene_type:complete
MTVEGDQSLAVVSAVDLKEVWLSLLDFSSASSSANYLRNYSASVSRPAGVTITYLTGTTH